MSGLPEWLRIGTSSWSAPSWQGVFYPAGTQPVDYITHYAREFDTVEIDTTFYRIPSARMVDGWRERTPERFTFAAKMPQVITHEKFLEDCDQETDAFIKVMERLGDRLGPLLLQFRYFRKAEFPDADPFIDRLERYLPKLPAGRKFVVEVRNKHFVPVLLLVGLLFAAIVGYPWYVFSLLGMGYLASIPFSRRSYQRYRDGTVPSVPVEADADDDQSKSD